MIISEQPGESAQNKQSQQNDYSGQHSAHTANEYEVVCSRAIGGHEKIHALAEFRRDAVAEVEDLRRAIVPRVGMHPKGPPAPRQVDHARHRTLSEPSCSCFSCCEPGRSP